jgi:catechol 2,3-dioxygenase-like lactoylglutathione lyase family enzyme
MIDHTGIGVADVARSAAFYDHPVANEGVTAGEPARLQELTLKARRSRAAT